MVYYSKIAIFDLDDTLYKGNSHIEWLCWYYNTSLFKSILFKVIGKCLPAIQRIIMWKLYNKAPMNSKANFTLPFRMEIVKLLQEKKKNGYHIVIVSNAPKELIRNAASILKVEFINAEIGKKAKTFKSIYHFNKLFVCTDNKTDLDILKISDSSIIICKKKDYSFYLKKLSNKNLNFISKEELNG